MKGRLLLAGFLAVVIASAAFPGLVGARGDANLEARNPAIMDWDRASFHLEAAQAPDVGAEATYIVIGSAPPLAAYRGGVAGLAPTSPAVTGALRLDSKSSASRAYLDYLSEQQTQLINGIESKLSRDVDILFRYEAALNGLALRLRPNEVDSVASLPGVELVVRDFARQLLTDNGPAWIGAPAVWNGPGTRTRGEGVVIGVIDTGINTDHPSFRDPGPVDGFNHVNPRGHFFGLCGPTGAPFCNDKLIGVYDFTGAPPFTGEDGNGHGSHTASTAAGNVLDASLVAPTITLDRRISGVAPHANLIAYRACQELTGVAGLGGCLVSALVAAINQATLDAVDVINYSIGGGSANPWTDLDAIAFLNARSAGIFVSVSAGNSGPGPRTIGSPADAPWVLSVGASTHNRKLNNALVGMVGGGSAPPAGITGKSLTSGYPAEPLVAPIVYAGTYGFPLCGDGTANPTTGEAQFNPFPPGTFNGEIVVCDRGTYGRVEKASNVKEGGAGGFVLANDLASGASLVGDAYPLPGVHITYADGVVLKGWLASGTGHAARIRGTLVDETFANGDVMASFSSRGPNPAVPDIIKPDVTAPGVDILAAFHDGAGPAPQYGIISGTSMSSPHAAGAAALVRARNPAWGPDEVRSALMTTAFTTLPGTGPEAHGILKETGSAPADAFDMGAGRIDLSLAARAVIVLDESASNYGSFNAPPGDPKGLNLPSMADDACSGTCSWTRVLKNGRPSPPITWDVTTSAPPGVALSVSPTTFTLGGATPGATRSLTVTADVNAATPGQWHFGQVTVAPRSAPVPAVHLPVAVFAKGGLEPPRLALHFHGNGHGDHDSDHEGEPDCTGDGKLDIAACAGPMLLKSGILSPSPAASWKGGFTEWAVDGGNDRTVHDPNWIWCLAVDTGMQFQCPVTETPAQGTTTIGGPTTIEWWTVCLPLCPLGTDWDVEIWADGVRVLQQRVDPGSTPNVPTLLAVTVDIPRVTATHRIVVEVEPVFLVDQSVLFSIFYDSADPCAPTGSGACDSRVFMPVEGLQPANRAPTAVDDAATTPRNTPVTVHVLANDGDPDGDGLTVVSVTQGQSGTVVNNGDGTVTYTPNQGFTGEDTFTYTISDGRGGSDSATVRITVPNNPPNAVNDAATTRPSTPVTVIVKWNDNDPDGDPIDVTQVTDPPRGTATLNPDDSVTYTPDSSFRSGTDTFQYTLVDDRAASDVATVTITVSTAKMPDLLVTELQAVNNRPDDADDDFDNDGRRDEVDDDDDNDGLRDTSDDDDDNDNRRDDRTREGDKVTITATIRNTGMAQAGPSKTEFRIDGSRIALVDTGSISAGGQRKISITWDSRGAAPGLHEITATADRNSHVTESNETNNSRTTVYTVQPNQVANGSFEEDTDANAQPDGWSPQSTGAGAASYSAGGCHGAKSVSAVGNEGNVAVHGSPTWTSAPIAVRPGTLMDLQLCASANEASSPGRVLLVYLGLLGDVVGIVTLLTTPDATNGFVSLEKSVTIPVGVLGVKIVLAGFSPTDVSTAGTVSFDDLGLFER